MTDKQHPAQFDWATELLDAEGHVTLSAKEANEIGARLRSMGEKLKAYEDLDEAASDVQLLRMGYAAARLEIESLQARIKTMAEEHADELMVAHLDGRMRAAQPAPQQEAQEPGAAYAELPKDVIRAVFIENGFTVKEGQTDLKQYVYDAANELLRRARLRAAEDPNQAPAAQGNEAPPDPSVGDAPAPGGQGGVGAQDGAAVEAAKPLKEGATVRVRPHDAGPKNAPYIGQTGTLRYLVGQRRDTWRVAFPAGTARKKEAVESFNAAHLEVVG